MDLENFEEEDGFKLDKAFIDDLIPARDAALARANKLTLFGLLIFAVLASDYFAVGVQISIPGAEISNLKGAREFLIFLNGIVGILGLVAQNNAYTMDSAIKYVIESKFPEGVRGIYIAKYFYHDNFNRYFPQSLPHFNFTNLQSNFVSLLYIGLLTAIIFYALAFMVIGVMISVDVWINGGLGWLSRFVAAGSLVNAILSWGYFITTRSKMPYRDYFKLQELDVVKQIAPSQLQVKNDLMYGDGTTDYRNLLQRGYLGSHESPDDPPYYTSSPRPFARLYLFLLVLIVAGITVF